MQLTLNKFKAFFRKKRVVALSCFVAILLLFILFRNSFLGFALEVLINSKFEKGEGVKCKFEKIALHQNGIVFNDFELSGKRLPLQLHIDKLRLSLKFNLKEFEIEPVVEVEKPKITLLEVKEPLSSKNSMSSFLKMLHRHLFLTVKEGELLFKDGPSVFFTFDTYPEQDLFKIFSSKKAIEDKEKPMGLISLTSLPHELLASVDLDHVDLTLLLHLNRYIPLIHLQDWIIDAGMLSGKAMLHISAKGKVQEAKIFSEFANLKMRDQKTGIEADLELATLSSHFPIYNIETEGVLKGLYLVLDGHTRLELAGQLAKGELFLGGNLKIDEETSEVVLRGKIDEPNALSPRFGLNLSILKDDHPISSIDFGFENIKPGYSLLRGNFQQVDVSHLNVLQKLIGPYVPILSGIELKEGHLECELVCQLIHQKLVEIHIEKVKARGLHLNFHQKRGSLVLFSSKLEGSVDIDLELGCINEWALMLESTDCIYTSKKAETWKVHDLNMRISSDVDTFSYSTIKGRLFDHEFEVALCGSRKAPDIDLCVKTTTEAILTHLVEEKRKAKAPGPEIYELHATFQREMDAWRVRGEIGAKDPLTFGFKLTDFALKDNLKEQFLEISHHVFSGWFKAKGLKPTYYDWVMYALDVEWELKGLVDVIGRFDGTNVKCEVTSSLFSFLSKVVDVTARERDRKQMSATLSYHFSSNDLDLLVPLTSAECEVKEFGLKITDITGDLYLRDDKLFVHNMEGVSHDVKMGGQLDLVFDHQDPSYLEIHVDQMSGDAKDLILVAGHFPDFKNLKINVGGDIKAIDQGFTFKSTLKEGDGVPPAWKLAVHLSEGELKLDSFTLKNFTTDAEFFSCDNACQIKNYSADISLGNTPYIVSGKYVKFGLNQQGLVEIDLSLEDELLTFLHLEATGEQEGEQYKWSIDPKETHFLSSSIESPHLISNLDFKDWRGNIQFDLEGKEIKTLFELIAKLKRGIKQPLALHKLFECHDFLQVDFAFDQQEKSLGLELQCREMTFSSIRSRPFHMLFKKKGTALTLEDFSLGDVGLSFIGHLEEGRLLLEKGAAKYLHSSLELEGGKIAPSRSFLSIKKSNLDLDELMKDFFAGSNKAYSYGNLEVAGTVDIEGMKTAASLSLHAANFASSGYELSSLTPIKVDYTKGGDFVLSHFDLRFRDKEHEGQFFDLCAQKVQTDFNKWTCKELEVAVTAGMFANMAASNQKWLLSSIFEKIQPYFSIYAKEHLIQMKGDFEVEGPHVAITGIMKEGKYFLAGEEWEVTNPHFVYQDGQIQIAMDTYLKNVKVHAKAEMNLKEENRLKIELCPLLASVDEGDGITICGSFSHDAGLKIDNIAGHLLGVSVEFMSSYDSPFDVEAILSGQAKIDIAKLSTHLKGNLKQIFSEVSLGSFLLIHGEIVLDRRDYTASYFKGFVQGRDLEVGGYELRNLLGDLFIAANEATIANLRLSDQAGLFVTEEAKLCKKEDTFEFELKGIKVEEFRPSLMRTVKDLKPKARPFVVRSLSIPLLKGNLSDLSSIQGKGELHFLNTFKSEHQLRFIPLELITRLGLDLGLMVPVRGEIDFQIENQKIKLLQLRNSFSEGKRSHFYFPSLKGCYIGFDGDMHIDVKMKQYVLFKITQPLTISVRGSVMKPKVSLK